MDADQPSTDGVPFTRDLRRAAHWQPGDTERAATVGDRGDVLGEHPLQAGEVTATGGVEEPLDQHPILGGFARGPRRPGG